MPTNQKPNILDYDKRNHSITISSKFNVINKVYMVQELTYVLSGGVINQDPDLSIGGPPSPTIIDDTVNNLFADVTGAQTNSGYTDYRCYYVFNDNEEDYVNFEVWIDSQIASGSVCTIGVLTQNEIQNIQFVNVSGGDFTLSLDGHVTNTIPFTFSSDLMASGIQSALRALPNANQCVVTAQGSDAYQIEYTGINMNTAYPMMTFDVNNLLPNNPLQLAGAQFTRIQGGSPVNTIAPDTGVVTTPPTGITFSEPDANSPFLIGTVRIGDGFPVWIKRVTDPETDAIANDSITVTCQGDRVPGGL